MIYLIKSGDYLKIGYSQYPEKRIYELQIGNPEKLKIFLSRGNHFDKPSDYNGSGPVWDFHPTFLIG